MRAAVLRTGSGDILADRRYNYAQASLRERDFETAFDVFEQVLERVPGWPPAWFGLGLALSGLADTRPSEAARFGEASVAAFRRTLALDPDDHLGAAIELARLSFDPSKKAISRAFVAELFDGYAPRFDDHLTRDLGYDAPAQLVAAVKTAAGLTGRAATFVPVVDLGCGTGLGAQAFAVVGRRFTGVDLSAAMIAEARRKDVYAELVVGSIEDFLHDTPDSSVDLVIAADVFAYVGELTPLVKAIGAVLTEAGLLGFTVQIAADVPFAVGSDRRYSHSRAYVRTVLGAAGMQILVETATATRLDCGVPVPSLVVVAGRFDAETTARTRPFP